LAQAQRAEVIIQGSVFEKKQNNIENPVSAIKVIYSKKVFAFTDKDGKFSIKVPDTASRLIVVYDKIGTDTIQITDINK
jgi:hypothetical protein